MLPHKIYGPSSRRRCHMARNNYPASVNEIIVAGKKYNPAALRAVKRFAKSKPWQGTLEERHEKLRQLNVELAAAYGVQPPALVFRSGGSDGDSGASCYIPGARIIILRGKLSVITYLHEFAHHLYGHDEQIACRWSVNLFRRCFPKSWTKVKFDGHMVRRTGSSEPTRPD